MKVIFIIIIVSLFFIKSCYTPPENSEVLNIGYIPIAECLPLYVAEEMGYFHEQGLKVELKPSKSGDNIIDKLLKHENLESEENIDIGFTNKYSYQSNLHKLSVAFGSTQEEYGFQNHGIFINKDLSLSDCKALNANVSCNLYVNSANNISEKKAKNYLIKEKGIKEINIKTKPTHLPDILRELSHDSHGVAGLVEPYIFKARELEKNGKNIKYLGNHYMAESKGEDVCVAFYVYVKERQDLKSKVLRFKEALLKATTFVNENESKAREFLLKYTQLNMDTAMKIGLSRFLPGDTSSCNCDE